MIANMRIIQWMCGHSRLNRIRNEAIGNKVQVTPIENKIGETTLR